MKHKNPDDYVEPRCPICGELCEIVFKNMFGEIVGCDNCVYRADPSEEMECYNDD